MRVHKHMHIQTHAHTHEPKDIEGYTIAYICTRSPTTLPIIVLLFEDHGKQTRNTNKSNTCVFGASLLSERYGRTHRRHNVSVHQYIFTRAFSIKYEYESHTNKLRHTRNTGTLTFDHTVLGPKHTNTHVPENALEDVLRSQFYMRKPFPTRDVTTYKHIWYVNEIPLRFVVHAPLPAAGCLARLPEQYHVRFVTNTNR